MSDDREPVDKAIELAAARTREAEEHFLEVPPDDEEALPLVLEVERRAEDLEALASEPELPVDD